MHGNPKGWQALYGGGYYLQMGPAKGHQPAHNVVMQPNKDGWERIEIKHMGNGEYAVMGYPGWHVDNATRYLRGNPHNNQVDAPHHYGSWEKWRVEVC